MDFAFIVISIQIQSSYKNKSTSALSISLQNHGQSMCHTSFFIDDGSILTSYKRHIFIFLFNYLDWLKCVL